jgi:hypothetical protein
MKTKASTAWSETLSPQDRRAVLVRSVATVEAQQRSGAGYPADQALRQFHRDYSNRVLTHGNHSLPASFEVNEAFFDTRPDVLGLMLRPERDYLVSFADFLDYVTAADAPQDDLGQSLEEGVVYNVSSLDRPDDLLLQTDAQSSFGFIAACLVREKDELSVLMVLGEQRPPELTAQLEKGLLWSVVNPGKPFLKSLDVTDNKPVTLPDSALMRTVALARFNLKERRLESRSLMYEFDKSYHVITDSERMLPRSNAQAAERAESAGVKLDAMASVWEIAKTLVLLPAYLAARVELIQAESRSSRLGSELKSSLKAQRAVEHAATESRIQFRRISAVRVRRTAPLVLEGRSYRAPAFQVPVDGFWRYFSDPERHGHDETGQLAQGRTWVRAHLRHKDKDAPLEQKVVYIKASLNEAKRRLEKHRKALAAGTMKGAAPERKASPSPAPLEVEGRPDVEERVEQTLLGSFVYVMRCPAHGLGIYKVGYTDRDPEIRARELSNATGVPEPLLVVEAWAVRDGFPAEQAAHRLIAHFRLSEHREFFRVSTYSEFRKLVVNAIEPWAL